MRSTSELAVRPRDPSSVEGTARSIVGQAQFRPAGRSLPQRILHWIAQELGRLFSHLPSGGGSLPVPSWLIVTILALLVIGAVVVIVRQGAFRGGRPKRKRSPPVMVSADDLGVAADVWLRRAEAAEAAGDWREAVRCRYRALVALLVAAGAVTEEIGRTAGEYRTAVERTVAEAAPSFGAATDTFEETWYGLVPAGPSQSEVVAAAAGPVTDVARRYRHAKRATEVVDRSTSAGGGPGDVGADDVDVDLDRTSPAISGPGPRR